MTRLALIFAVWAAYAYGLATLGAVKGTEDVYGRDSGLALFTAVMWPAILTREALTDYHLKNEGITQ